MAIFGSASGGAFVGFTPNNKHDLKGEELYFESLLKADDKMAKLDAAAKPNLDQYDKELEKLKALPGEKAFLHAQYKNVLSGLQEGANKSGGWLRYASSDDYKEKIGKLNNWTYNTAQAEQNYDAYDHLMKTAKPNDMDAMYIDANGNPLPVVVGKKVKYLSNKEYLNKVAGYVDMKQDGTLNALPISLNLGERGDFVSDINKLAEGLGHTKGESAFKVLEGIAATSKGYQQYMQAGTTTSMNNISQIKALAGAVMENLSAEGKNGIMRSWNQSGRKQPLEQYVHGEALKALASRVKSETSNNMGITKLGAGADDFGNPEAYLGAIMNAEPLYTGKPIEMKMPAPNGDGKLENQNFTQWKIGPNHEALGKLFKEKELVNRPFIHDGVVYSQNAIDNGTNVAPSPEGLTYGKVVDVTGMYFKSDANGNYVIPVSNKELADAGVVVKPGEAPANLDDARMHGFKWKPAAHVQMSGVYSDVTKNGNNIYGLTQDEKGKITRQSKLATGVIPSYFPYDQGGDLYKTQLGIQSQNNDSRFFNVDASEDGVTEWGDKKAKVNFIGIVPLDEGDLPNDGTPSYNYVGYNKSGLQQAAIAAKAKTQQSVKTFIDMYKPK